MYVTVHLTVASAGIPRAAVVIWSHIISILETCLEQFVLGRNYWYQDQIRIYGYYKADLSYVFASI